MARKQVKFNINPLLSGPTLESRNRSGSPYRELPIADIDVDPDQPRKTINPESLAELTASIKEHGLLCPVLVRLTGGGSYRLVAGERRYRACVEAGLETIPAIIQIEAEIDAAGDILAKQLVENLQREDLNPMERAIAIGQLRDAQGLSIREIAKNLGASKGLVQRSLELLALPDDLQTALLGGASETKILLLGQIEDRETRQELLTKLNQLTRNQLEEEILNITGKGRKKEMYHGSTSLKQNNEPVLTIADQRIIEEIQKILGMKVNLMRKNGKIGQGKVIIEFYSDEDLKEVYRRLVD